jgi:pyruvate formate lyase activating enzyme
MGLWLEIVTLLIPGFNDSDDELQRLTEFVASVSVDIPWHVTAFHKDYKMTDPGDTTPPDLLRAARIGKRAGLRYVYAGNLPGQVGNLEDTRCPQCAATLIQRFGYRIQSYRVTPQGNCPDCKTPVPGRWAAQFETQTTAHPFLPHRASGFVTITHRR